jgi:hypothetical protein
MKYYDGTEVQVGDEITVEGKGGVDLSAVVKKIVQPNTKDAEEWSLPDGGIVIEGTESGLFTTNYLDKNNEIAFVRRSKETLS